MQATAFVNNDLLFDRAHLTHNYSERQGQSKLLSYECGQQLMSIPD